MTITQIVDLKMLTGESGFKEVVTFIDMLVQAGHADGKEAGYRVGYTAGYNAAWIEVGVTMKTGKRPK